MLKLLNLTQEKFKKYETIFVAMENLDKEFDSLVFLYEYKNKEKILQIDNHICRIWYYIDSDAISYREFQIDDNYEISLLALDDAILIEEDNETFFKNRITDCYEDFAFIPKKEKDNQGYDGIAIYSQFNEEKDIRIELMYQHMTKPNNQVYKMHLKNPIQVLIVKKASKNKSLINKNSEMYARYDFDIRKNYKAFKTATIKDYGLLNTLKKDLLSLQKSSQISRYYKVLSINSNNEVTVSYPFGNQYKLEQINNYIESLGFNSEVPDYLIETHNQKNDDYMESLLLAANLKVYNQAYEKEKGHSLILKNN